MSFSASDNVFCLSYTLHLVASCCFPQLVSRKLMSVILKVVKIMGVLFSPLGFRVTFGLCPISGKYLSLFRFSMGIFLSLHLILCHTFRFPQLCMFSPLFYCSIYVFCRTFTCCQWLSFSLYDMPCLLLDMWMRFYLPSETVKHTEPVSQARKGARYKGANLIAAPVSVLLLICASF